MQFLRMKDKTLTLSLAKTKMMEVKYKITDACVESTPKVESEFRKTGQ